MSKFENLLPQWKSLISNCLQYPTLFAVVSASLYLLIWRLWRFIITPALHPSRPKELPYWIPYLGHAIGFFLNSYKVLETGRKYFQNSKEPYSITVAGQVIYIITCPEDVQSLYKHTTTISWLRFVQDIYRWIGISQPNINKLWQPPTEEHQITHPIRKLPPNQMVEAYQHHQLLPGENLDKMAKTFVSYVDERVRWQGLQKKRPYILESSSDAVTLSLMDWTADVFIHTTTEIYWGKSIWEIAPNLIESFLAWEETTWKYVFQLPRVLSRDMYAAKDELVDAFTAYFGQPSKKREDATYFVKTAEEELRDIAFGDRDIAKVNMLQHWAINGNIHKVTFWIFAYLIHNPELLESIRTETMPGVVHDVPDVLYLTEQCPKLEALFLEILRLEMSSSLMRYVTEPTTVGGKLLQKGNNVMVPYRQLHFDEDVWGNNAAQFDSERFLKDKSLSRSPSYRPFGGGQHLCPGRFLARRAVFTFVALSLSRFDISLDTATCIQRFPRANESKPGLGALAPILGDRVILRLGTRSSKEAQLKL